MTLVADSSVVIATLLQQETQAAWADSILRSDDVAVPTLLQAEVAGVLRRRTLAGEITDSFATAAYIDLLTLPFDLHDFEPYAGRIWELRHTVTIKDAWFVAIAEALDAPLATLDSRLTRAPGPRCQFVTPPDEQ